MTTRYFLVLQSDRVLIPVGRMADTDQLFKDSQDF